MAVRPPTAQDILALQRGVGNAAVGRMLQRVPLPAPTPMPPRVQEAALDAATNALAIAQAESEAAATAKRIGDAIDRMKTAADPTVRNTAELFAPPTPRLRLLPMTPRIDSEAIRSARNKATGTVVYLFTGTTHPPLDPDHTNLPGTHEVPLGAMGKAVGDTVLIRDRGPDGTSVTDEKLVHAIVHEASHSLAQSYGQSPLGSQNRGERLLFDVYKDEFRAFFVSEYAGIKDLDERAEAVKRRLVGESGDYPLLREEYHSRPTGWFRVAVDAHVLPYEFNLTNSIRLDALFMTLSRAAKDSRAVADVLAAIDDLLEAERDEAKKYPTIMVKIEACGPAAARRIRRELYGSAWEPTLARTPSRP